MTLTLPLVKYHVKYDGDTLIGRKKSKSIFSRINNQALEVTKIITQARN